MATATIEIFKLLKEEVGEEKAEKIVGIIEESIETIREEAKAQKPVLKAEIREELRKELVTKEEFFGETGKLRQEMETLRQEMETLRQEMRTFEEKMKRWLLLLGFLVIILNKGTIEFAFKVLGLLK